MGIPRKAVGVGVIVGALLSPGIASAHSVGVPGEANCFGKRMSHGSSDHGLTPADRAANLQGLYDEESPEGKAFFDELLGIENGRVNVAVMKRWVRLNCSGEFEL